MRTGAVRDRLITIWDPVGDDFFSSSSVYQFCGPVSHELARLTIDHGCVPIFRCAPA